MRGFKLFIISLFLCSSAYAGTVSMASISADATDAGFNNNFTILANALNGNVEGSTDGGASVSNIKADSIFEINMGDDANPRLRDAELLGITVDTISGGAASSQGSYVYSGCTPATDSDLTSDVSACTAFVNGYRVVKSATAQTYANNSTTYLWISQTGSYTQNTNPNTSVANSALLASVVTSGGQITTVTDLANRQLPGLIIPKQYRTGLVVSKDSTTTITVLPGSCEINSVLLNKTATTTLTISTAGDWAGGSSLRAASTYGFVGMDASGNLKLHTTAPTHDNYGVSTTAGKKRYATWSSAVYRILGWFYMEGAQLVENASNIKEGDVANIISSNDTNILSGFSSTTPSRINLANFYSSGGPLLIMSTVSGDEVATTFDHFTNELFRNGAVIPGAGADQSVDGGVSVAFQYLDLNRPQGTSNYAIHAKIDSGDLDTIRRRSLIVSEQ